MIATKKYRHKPIYKQFLNLKNNVQNRKKLLKLKKKKWQNLMFKLNRSTKTRKRNCYYKFFDQNSYNTSRYKNFFSNNYKDTVLANKSFNLYYGGLGKNYLKGLVKKSTNKSNQIQNKINLKKFFSGLLERRLDVVLLRAHFVLSIRNDRQLISHRHVLVNKKVVNDCSFLLRKGDQVSLSKKSHKLVRYYLVMSDLWPLTPSYLQVSYRLFQIQVLEDIMFLNSITKTYMWLNLNTVINSYVK
jgi:ribosomal protein S4